MLHPQKFDKGFLLSVSTPTGTFNFYSMSEARLTLTHEDANSLLEHYASQVIPGFPLGINLDSGTTFQDNRR
jgi:hypothetical protein